MGKVKTFFWICVVAIACGACDRKKTEKTGAETDTLIIPVTVADTLVEEEVLDTLSFSSVREKYFSGRGEKILYFCSKFRKVCNFIPKFFVS